MNPSREHERLERRIDRLEQELREVRSELETLRKVETALSEPPPLPVASPPTPVPEPAPVIVPATPEFVQPPMMAAPVVERIVPPLAPRSAPVTEFVPEPKAKWAEPDWRDWLRSLNLWPPAGEGNAEVRLGAWWATRLGTLLAVIGVVFFGVYVSINTAPWVKFLELLTLSLGVTAGGFWLERKLERFGAVVAAGGLALVYFSAFAAHAVPAVRVIESPLAAGGWQLLAVGAILGAALWRRSPVMATMAVGLGAVTAFFALTGGFSGFALFTIGMLAVVSVLFARLRKWEAPAVLALPAVHAVYLAVWAHQWLHGAAPAGGLPWWFLGGITVAFFLRDWRGAQVEADEVSRGERWFQGFNSSLAALSGVITALTLYRGELEWFYFGAAALFAAMAWVRRRQVRGDLVEVLLLAKASGALTLGVIELTAGRTTALALLVQAAVLAWLAPRLSARVLAWGAGIVAVLAAGFFAQDAVRGAPWGEALGPTVLFLPGWLWLAVIALRRWWPEVVARQWETAAGLAAGVLAVLAAQGWQPEGWAPAWQAGLALVMVASQRWRRSPAFVLAGGLSLFVAQVWLWRLTEHPVESGLWLNAAAALIPLAAVSWLLGGKRETRDAGLACLMMAVFGLWRAARVEFPEEVVLAGSVGLGVLLTAISPWTRGRRWQAAGCGAVALGVWQVLDHPVTALAWVVPCLGVLWVMPVLWHESRRHREEAAGVDAWVRPAQLGLAVAATVCLLPDALMPGTEVLVWSALGLGLSVLRRWRETPGALIAGLAAWGMAALRLDHVAYGVFTGWLVVAALAAWVSVALLRADPSRWGTIGATVAATLMTAQVSSVALRGEDRLWLLVLMLPLVAGLCRWLAVKPARVAALALAALGLGQAVWLIGNGRAMGLHEEAAAVASLATVVMLLPVWLARERDELSAGTREALRWLCGAGGALLALMLVRRQSPPLSSYVTVGWGIAAILIFAIGLVARLRSHRLLGLLVLAVCVPRVFVVDLHSALHRIVAFIALGLVLLWVGFSYHRFRHLIAGEKEETSS